jgi:flagellar motor switch protein FliN/FliY
MQTPEISETLKSIGQRFCESFTQTLSEACASGWQVRLADPPSGTRPDNFETASFRCRFEGACAGDAILAFPSSLVPKLSLRDVAQDAPDMWKAQAAKLRAVVEEGLRGLAASFGEAGSTSVLVEDNDGINLTDEQVFELWIQSDASDEATRVPLHLCFSRKLLAGLLASAAKPFVFEDAGGSEAANLDLVMDVELNVTLRFGQRQLALREVLELNSGSVVELDRQVDEPVELILDGRVVARGEAVIVDGNYGMRITQLVQHLLP